MKGGTFVKKYMEFRFSNSDGRKSKPDILADTERRANKHKDRFYGYYSDEEER